MKYGIYIGGPKPKAAAEFRKAIGEILSSGVDQATMQKALEVLGNGVKSTQHTKISDVNLVGEKSYHEYNYEIDTDEVEEDDDPIYDFSSID